MTQSTMNEFEEQLTQLFNNNALPFEAKRYVVLSFFRHVEDVYQQKIRLLKENQQQEGEEQNV